MDRGLFRLPGVEAVERGLVTVEQVARLVGGASDRTSWRLTQALEQL